MALGSFVMTIPHFATDVYELGAEAAETCLATREQPFIFKPLKVAASEAAYLSHSAVVVIQHHRRCRGGPPPYQLNTAELRLY